MILKYLLLVLIGSLSLSSNAKCTEIRAAFDIGSGSTKLKVAKVNTCLNKIEKVLTTTSRAVSYKDDLEKNKDLKLSTKIINKGVFALKELKKIAIDQGASSFFAVATSAARSAKNTSTLIQEFKKKLNINVKVISQKTEAKLGYIAALSFTGTTAQNALVWDIGGGSMQMSFKDVDSFHIYEGKLAAVSFKNHLIHSIKKESAKTPNPIGQKNYIKALHDAKIVAKFSIPDRIKSKLKQENTKVIGIGGVHYHCIGKQLNKKKTYTLKQLSSLIPKALNLKDEDIKSQYAETDVSNLILVEAFMQELGIKNISLAQVNLSDALLLSGDTYL